MHQPAKHSRLEHKYLMDFTALNLSSLSFAKFYQIKIVLYQSLQDLVCFFRLLNNFICVFQLKKSFKNPVRLEMLFSGKYIKTMRQALLSYLQR